MPADLGELIQKTITLDGSQHAQRRSLAAVEAVDGLHGDRLHTKAPRQFFQFAAHGQVMRRVQFEAESALFIKNTGIARQQSGGTVAATQTQRLLQMAAPPATETGQPFPIRRQIAQAHPHARRLLTLWVGLNG